MCRSNRCSGGKFRHGKIIKEGNKWIRWVYIEVASRSKTTLKKFYIFILILLKENVLERQPLLWSEK